MLSLTAHGYELSSDAGERQLIASGDRQTLRSALAARRQLEGGDPPLILRAEDGVRYEVITTAMDDARAAGCARLELGRLAL